MKKTKRNWKAIGRIALALAVAGVATYIISRKLRKNNAEGK